MAEDPKQSTHDQDAFLMALEQKTKEWGCYGTIEGSPAYAPIEKLTPIQDLRLAIMMRAPISELTSKMQKIKEDLENTMDLAIAHGHSLEQVTQWQKLLHSSETPPSNKPNKQKLR